MSEARTTGWGFALSRRWFGYLALAIAFAVVCSSLGMWQFARRAEARAEIDRIDTNYDGTPVPVADALDGLDDFQESQKWLQVTLEGEYLGGDELLVRNRPLAGQPGFEVLTPLRLDTGDVFIVDRGWLPTGSRQDAPDSVPAAPSGHVMVTARLKAGEPTIAGVVPISASGQIGTVHLPQIADKLGEQTYTGAYGLLVEETPAAETTPTARPKPPRDEGPHLSYALQWFVFALLGFVGLGVALRQEYRILNADDPDERERADERNRRKAARAPTDSETEDAILESLDRR